ncbi:hypothetical protein D3C73_671830 [compost metagenome]
MRFMMNSQKPMISATGSSRPSRPDHHGWRVVLTSTETPVESSLSTSSVFGTGVVVENFFPSLVSPVTVSPRTTTDLICWASAAARSWE